MTAPSIDLTRATCPACGVTGSIVVAYRSDLVEAGEALLYRLGLRYLKCREGREHDRGLGREFDGCGHELTVPEIVAIAEEQGSI